MPWQRQVADVALELLPNGEPAYREIGVTVPRQSGKTTLVLAVALDRATLYKPGTPQTILYTAQTGLDARTKLLDDLYDGTISGTEIDRLVRRVYRAKGEERIKFVTNSVLKIMASGEHSGHGKTLNLGFIDEAFADYDDRREQAIKPAMVTKSDAQIWWLSTAGTDDSIFLLAKEELGRRAIEADTGRGLAYFEWSADPESDRDDVDSWWEFMPALGHTIDVETIKSDSATMKPEEFDRAYRNLWTAQAASVIAPALWEACQSESAAPNPASLAFGIDVAPDRSAAAIVAADPNGEIELVEFRNGVDWLAPRANELARTHRATIALDGGGPAGGLLDDLDRPTAVGGVDVSRACAAFYDAATAGELSVRPSGPLNAAVRGAVKKELGDRFVWSRKASSENAAPLVAATLALWAARHPERRKSNAKMHTI
jgi:phage terminase large subunit-like protein